MQRNVSVPKLDIDGRTLFAVPAVHYRAVFAQHVHSVCSSDKDRPDAIAVELGQAAVSTISAWLRELKVDTGENNLPTMLGLVRANRYIHPKFKDKAIRLQKHYGRPFHQLPQHILWEHFSYAPVSLLCLSATDSIIEAIRCALEWDIPVYGVDLGEIAPLEKEQILIEEPLRAQEGLIAYTLRNQNLAAKCRDPYIDARREWVMASQLKTVLRHHKRVLFTCGLAHWSNICKLLSSSLSAAADLPFEEAEQFTRVLVHPSLALRQMDLFPGITGWYEKKRRNASKTPGNSCALDFKKIYLSQLNAAYSSYMAHQAPWDNADEQAKDIARLPDFEHFLHHLCAVKRQQVPGLSTLFEASEAMMSKEFCRIFGESLILHETDWAQPENWPDLPIMGYAPGKNAETASRSATHMVRLGIPYSKQDSENQVFYDFTDPFYVSSSRQRDEQWIQWEFAWGSQGKTSSRSSEIMEFNNWEHWIWPSCEFLLHGTAFKAAEIISANQQEKRVEPFEGSLLDGIDLKATIRARIRGNKTIYVKRKNDAEDLIVAEGHTLEPTVFIFENPLEACIGDWEVGAAGLANLRDHVFPEELARFDNIVKQYGRVFVGGVYYSRPGFIADNLKPHVMSCKEYIGMVTFGNPCVNIKQSAMWLKATRYGAGPILHKQSLRTLLDFYRAHHGIAIDTANWAASLVQLAIPYARKHVVIIAPEQFVLDAKIKETAQIHQINLDLVPLRFFSKQQIREVRRRFSVNIGKGGFHIPEEKETMFGPKDKYLHLLPPGMQAQVWSSSLSK